MTKFIIPVIGRVYLVIVLDWYTKKIVGWDISLRSKASDWREAIERAIDKEFPDGVRGQGLKLISDNGSEPTAPSFMRTIKEEIIWLNEFGSFEEAKERIGKWIEVDYNKLYVHSELGYMSPEEFEDLYYKETLRKAA